MLSRRLAHEMQWEYVMKSKLFGSLLSVLVVGVALSLVGCESGGGEEND